MTFLFLSLFFSFFVPKITSPLKFIKQVHHPSALDMFEQITNASKGKQIVMFLDYDGTLSPIVEDPDQAFMSDSVSLQINFLTL